MTLSGLLKGVAAGLFVVSLPVLFGTSSLRWLVADTGWYQAGFEKYGVSARTGISPAELARSADQISKYLVFQRERVDDITVTINGQTQPLFKDRENRHMADVKALMGRFYDLQTATGIYALLYLMISRFWLGQAYWRSIGRGLRWGGALTLGMFAVVGALASANFDEFWTRFHLISFDNDLWMLDPTKDNLIMMFPEGFWYDSVIRFALATGSQAVAAIAVGFLITRMPPAPNYQQMPVNKKLAARGK